MVAGMQRKGWRRRRLHLGARHLAGPLRDRQEVERDLACGRQQQVP